MSSAPATPHQPSIDVRTLSLAQLQKLAERGSRRARAELDSRLRAPQAPAAPSAPAVAPPVAPARAPGVHAAAPVPAPAPVAAPGPVPQPRQRRAPAPQPAGNATPESDAAPDALTEKLQLIARQDEARTRLDGPPRLVGLVLMGCGLLFVLIGLIALRHGGLYYGFCGLAFGAVGWLLLQRSRWAMAAHGALLAVALGWAWASQRSLAMALVQAGPLLVAALWMAVGRVREGLA